MKSRSIVAYIRKNETGEVRKYESTIDFDEEGSPETFIWEEGNYACDCNRELFFERAANKEDPNRGCGFTMFDVNLSFEDDEKLFYQEFDN